MTEDASPILDYYPKKFEQDLNGKRQDWEAVVLIPFIDESKLLTAMLVEASKLSQEEIFRNLRGALLCYRYNRVLKKHQVYTSYRSEMNVKFARFKIYDMEF